MIWAAGIRGYIPPGIDNSLIARGNRIKADRFNRVMGKENIFAIGDLAYMETPLHPNGHPQVANAAISQAGILARNLITMTEGKSKLQEFEYHEKGSMATVGRHLAVVDLPCRNWHFGSFFAWIIWTSLHLLLILGEKNRIQVFINWVYKYFTYDQSLRLWFRKVDR